jgi:hypothetical protein
VTSSGIGAPRDLPGARRPRWALAAAGLGLVLLTATAVAACQSQPPRDTGAATVTALASASPTAAAPKVAVRDGDLPTAAAAEAPVRLASPALRLDATVDQVGIDPKTGDFDVPPSVDRVGWYRFGPGLEATAGSIVVAGHVDSAEQGEGAFFRLGRMRTGDRITLTGPDGEKREFAVVARERYAKTRIPLAKYFARDGDLRLTLITCGGPFDQRTRSYRDNVVVTATPVRGR